MSISKKIQKKKTQRHEQPTYVPGNWLATGRRLHFIHLRLDMLQSEYKQWHHSHRFIEGTREEIYNFNGSGHRSHEIVLKPKKTKDTYKHVQ